MSGSGTGEKIKSNEKQRMDRRKFMAYFSAAGLAGTSLPAALWSQTQGEGPVTKEALAAAETVSGLEFTDEERELMLRSLNRNLRSYEALRQYDIPNSVFPAISFDPALPGMHVPTEEKEFRYTHPAGVTRPANLESLAFEPVTVLSELVRTRQVTSTELTRMYLDPIRSVQAFVLSRR